MIGKGIAANTIQDMHGDKLSLKDLENMKNDINEGNESATINWTDFLRAYTMKPYTERKNDYVRIKATKTETYIYV